MASTLPLNFPVPSEPSITSYDIDEIRDGVGYATYYLFTTHDNSGTNYVIDKEELYSEDNYLNGDVGGTTTTWTFTSYPFLTPKNVKGDILTRAYTRHNAAGAAATLYVQIKVYHYDGTTETQLGSTWQSENMTVAGLTNTYLNARINVATQKHFKIGDMIRVKVLTTSSGATGGTQWEVGFDPQNRSGNVIDTTQADQFSYFKLLMPYRTEL